MAANMSGLHPVFRNRVEAMLRDPEARALGMTVNSAYRSPDYQAQLFRAAVRKYGSERAARKWVAPPWRSNHGPTLNAQGQYVPLGPGHGGVFGGAVDLGLRGVKAVKGQWPTAKDQQVRAIAARYGLSRPMEWEDWHYEYNPRVRTQWDGGGGAPVPTPTPVPPKEEVMGPAAPIQCDEVGPGAILVALPDNTDHFHAGQVRWRHVSEFALRQLKEDRLVLDLPARKRSLAYVKATLGTGTEIS